MPALTERPKVEEAPEVDAPSAERVVRVVPAIGRWLILEPGRARLVVLATALVEAASLDLLVGAGGLVGAAGRPNAALVVVAAEADTDREPDGLAAEADPRTGAVRLTTLGPLSGSLRLRRLSEVVLGMATVDVGGREVGLNALTGATLAGDALVDTGSMSSKFSSVRSLRAGLIGDGFGRGSFEAGNGILDSILTGDDMVSGRRGDDWLARACVADAIGDRKGVVDSILMSDVLW